MSNSVEPYNDMWMDCVSNNLISMLINENKSFRNISLHMDSMYLKKVYNQSYSSENIQGELVSSGAYFPKIEYSLDMLDELIDSYVEEFSNLESDVHQCIKSALCDGFYVFVTVDRYFYPSGVNSNISHLYHPTFIYGYDEEQQCYLALEDCVVMGKMDKYRIPYYSVDASFEHLINANKPIKLRLCKVNESAKGFQHELEFQRLIEVLERSLAGTPKYNEDYDLHYHTGMDALDSYLSEFIFLFSNLGADDTYRTRTLSFCQNHTRNIEITHKIRDNYDINVLQIEKKYLELYKMWKSFKNSSFYFLEKRKVGYSISSKNMLELHSKLEIITEMERNATELLLSACCSL